jgi:hypothetical protein
VLEMDQVPKVLRPLVQEWLPEAYIVSFKVRHNNSGRLCPTKQKLISIALLCYLFSSRRSKPC